MKNNTNCLSLVFVLAVALCLRLAVIVFMSLSGDEISTIFQADFPLFQMLHRLANMPVADADIAPPLYFVILNLLLQKVSFSPFSFRLLSASFDMVTILLLFFFSDGLLSNRQRLYAVLYFALSPFSVWYGGEIRMYALLALCSTGSTLFWLRFLRESRLRDLLLYGLLSVAGLYTQYYFFLLVAGQSMLSLWYVRGRSLIKYFACVVAVGALFAPWIPALLLDLKILSTNSMGDNVVSFVAPFYVPLKMVFFGNGTFVRQHLQWYIVGFVVLLGLIVWPPRTRFSGFADRSATAIAFLVFLEVLMLGLIAFVRPMNFRPHATIYLVPLVCIMLAIFTVPLEQRRRESPFNRLAAIRVLLLVIWGVILISYNFNERYRKPPVQGAVELMSNANPDRFPVFNLPLRIPLPPAVFPGSFQLWEYYAKGRFPVKLARGTSGEDLCHYVRWHNDGMPFCYITLYEYQHAPDFYRDFFECLHTHGKEMWSTTISSAVDTFSIKIIFFRWDSQVQAETANLERCEGVLFSHA